MVDGMHVIHYESKFHLIFMKNPTQCALWTNPKLTPSDLNLELVEVFVRDPHLERDLFKCRECGQLYFREWYEHVNFKHDDYMYETYIPVTSKEEVAELLATKNSAELIQFFPQLHGSFTNGMNDSVQWLESSEV